VEAVIFVIVALEDAHTDLEEPAAGTCRVEAVLGEFLYRARRHVTGMRHQPVIVIGEVVHIRRSLDEPVAAKILALIGDVSDHSGMIEAGRAVEAERHRQIDLGRDDAVGDGLGRHAIQRAGRRGILRIDRHEGCIALGQGRGARARQKHQSQGCLFHLVPPVLLVFGSKKVITVGPAFGLARLE